MTVTLTPGEATALNSACGCDYKPGVEYEIHERLITDAIAELDRLSRWPGTKRFNREAAYNAELLRRVVARSAG